MMSSEGRALAVAAAAAHDINDDLTIIFHFCDTLAEHAAAREIRTAAQRIAWKSMGLLRYSSTRGAKWREGIPMTMEQFIAEVKAGS